MGRSLSSPSPSQQEEDSIGGGGQKTGQENVTDGNPIPGMVEICPGSKVYIPIHVFTSADLAAKGKWEDAFRLLLKAVFPPEVLATHSCLGQHSKRPGLDPMKLGALKSK